MNPQETLEFVAFIGKLRDEEKLTVLLIEHDMKRRDGRLRPGHRSRLRQEDRRRERRRRCSATRG